MLLPSSVLQMGIWWASASFKTSSRRPNRCISTPARITGFSADSISRLAASRAAARASGSPFSLMSAGVCGWGFSSRTQSRGISM